MQLIERAPKRVSLTVAGEEIVERARRILEASDEIVELAKGHRDPLAGRLKLALLPTIGPYLLPNVAGKLRKQLPRLELMLYEYQTDLMLEKLHSGEIDVGILALPVPLDGLDSLRAVQGAVHGRDARRSPAEPARQHQGRQTCSTKRCCCSKMATACATRRSTSARASTCTRSRTFAPRASKPCARWWPSGVGITLLPELAGRGAYGNGARRRDQAVRQPRADAHHRRGLAQVERAARRHPRARETDRDARAVIPQPFTLRAPDGRELAAHWFAAAQRRGVIVHERAPPAFRRRSISSWRSLCGRARLRRPGVRLPRHRLVRACGPRHGNRA